MKKLPLYIASALSVMAAMQACDSSDALTMPGSTLIQDQFVVEVSDTFTIEARSVLNPRVQSRTTTQLLGAIDAPTYGTLRADYVAQLFPANALDTAGVEIDSLKLQLVFDKGGFVGDSLAPIGFEVYPLADTLPYPIYSNFPEGTRFSPTDFYVENPGDDQCRGRGMFTASGTAISDAAGGSNYRFAYASLPKAFAQRIFDAYRDPQTRPCFTNPEEFASKIFPGVYVKASFGSGRVTRITDTRLMLYYTKRGPVENSEGVLVDSVRHLYGYIMSTAPEVVSNTNISLEMSDRITAMANDGRAVIVSPAGRDVELTFPLNNVINAYKKATTSALSVINTLFFSIPADSIANGRGINPPEHLLMVLKKDKDKFFAANKLPDDVTSFVATYNANTMSYYFGDMRDYLVEMMKKDVITPDDYTFTITPVSMIAENSSSYYASSGSSYSGMSPMIAMPSMVELLPKKAKATLTFSQQNL